MTREQAGKMNIFNYSIGVFCPESTNFARRNNRARSIGVKESSSPQIAAKKIGVLNYVP
jgi:hypothetical protein